MYDSVIHLKDFKWAEYSKTPDFTSWAKNENVDDSALLAAIQEVENGLIDAKRGGNVIKKRVARTGQGKKW
ncbi:hypothetical protein GCM10009347_34670 [Shewanella algicola]|uniref:Type II toxin-antitoxin system RelE/ParE family toxin n=1 Tax=Shewanella algicola TaxID=640633 RepID=A0A9X2CE18_9GAMM|nr:type II toxin-antitoxin system RelE/ParE family toxin [Shewanella algicola]MCL1107183.1 type II toxin-antitoxin system RelE/ParE family toxin [Shewanella algicola]GGP66021.1 hypothetical protein GCM10009347_34670 [Shewanella algicola]